MNGYMYNFRTKDYDYLTEEPDAEALRAYIPQSQAAQATYLIRRQLGDDPLAAAEYVLTRSLERDKQRYRDA
jgi:hypothetical protein